MEWSFEQLITSIVSILAFFLGIANFIHTRRLSEKERKRRNLEINLRVDGLLEEVHELLFGKEGYQITRIASKLPKAEVKLNKALTILPNYPKTIEYQGHLNKLRGNIHTAETKYLQSISLDPSRAGGYNSLSHISESEKAIRLLEEAIELEPDNSAEPFYNLGKIYAKLGDLTEAEKYFEKAVSAGFFSAYCSLGDILNQKGDFKQARLQYEKAISSDAQNILPMIKIGLLLMNNGNEKEGISWFDHAMKIDPTNTYPYEALAKFFADRSENKKALEYVQKAIGMDPKLTFSGKGLQKLRIALVTLIEQKEYGRYLTKEELEEEIVVLLKGVSVFGKSVFSYIALPLWKFVDLKDAIDSDVNFKPTDFGRIISNGHGEPSEELQERMNNQYNLVANTNNWFRKKS